MDRYDAKRQVSAVVRERMSKDQSITAVSALHDLAADLYAQNTFMVKTLEGVDEYCERRQRTLMISLRYFKDEAERWKSLAVVQSAVVADLMGEEDTVRILKDNAMLRIRAESAEAALKILEGAIQ